MSFTVWLSLAVICCLGAMSPGPSLAMVIKHTITGGRAQGVICAWAHSVGIGLYALVTLLGLAVVLQRAPMLFNTIAIVGACYLIWLGIKSLTAKHTGIKLGDEVSDFAAESKIAIKREYWQAARDGIAISLFNPKIMLFFVALFSQFVIAAETVIGQTLVIITPLLIDGLWYSFIALLLSIPSILKRIQQKTAIFDKIAGLVLIALGLRVLVSI